MGSFADRELWFTKNAIRARHFVKTTGLRVVVDVRDGGVSVADAVAFAGWVHGQRDLHTVPVMALCSPADCNSVRSQFFDPSKHQFIATTEREAENFIVCGTAPTAA